MKGPVAAIILAAGESTRMGQPKMVLPLRGNTVIGCTVANVVASTAEEVIVVLGFQAEKIVPLIQGTRAKTVINPTFRDGMLTSVLIGIRAVSPGTRAVMLMPGDQPTIRGTTINLVLKAFRNGDKGMAVPVCNGRRGHPIILSLDYAGELAALANEGARGLMYRHPEDVLEVPVDLPEIWVDIDTMEDYRRVSSSDNA